MKLIELLKQLETDESIVYSENLQNDNEDNPLLGDIDAEACGELINNDGSCNWANHKLVTDAGFRVSCAEKDSFGWLIGKIHTSKGYIYYG